MDTSGLLYTRREGIRRRYDVLVNVSLDVSDVLGDILMIFLGKEIIM